MLPNPNIYIIENSARELTESRLREAENQRNILLATRKVEEPGAETAKSALSRSAKARPIASRLLGMIRG